MALIYEWGFYVAADREEEFRSWLAANEEALARAAPENYEYLGTYVPVWGSENREGYRQIWRYGRERPPDLRAAAKEGSGTFTELARQFLAFVDESRSDDETFRLHRSVTDDPVRG